VNFLADEDVDQVVVAALRAAGYDLLYVAEESPGLSDSDILDRARAERRILITADKDFGDLVFRQRRLSTGVVLLRLAGLSPPRKGSLVVSSVRAHSDLIPGAFTVISPGGIRIRPAQPA
jgi:predicted nuclease of predicted toxin-antitoxin system